MKDNIILLGPKAVGKSLISEKLKSSLKKEGLGDYDVLSLDLFFKFCNQAYNEILFMDRNEASFHGEIAQLDPEDEFYDEYREKLIADRNKEMELLTSWIHDYNFADFSSIMDIYENIVEVQRFYRYLSNESFMIFDQTAYLMVLDKILSKAKKPLIIDAGGNIGCLHDSTKPDFKNIEYRFPNIDVKNYQRQVLEKIPIRVFIKPCNEYDQIPCPDIHDQANQMYLSNPDSYKTFANVTIKPNLFFGQILENYDRSNPAHKIMANGLVKDEEVEKSISEIIEQIKNLKVL